MRAQNMLKWVLLALWIENFARRAFESRWFAQLPQRPNSHLMSDESLESRARQHSFVQMMWHSK
jgi:hypothetical protein